MLDATLECLLIADDLTGACDSAVHFAARGRRTAACLGLEADAAGLDVLALSTDTRDAPPEEFARMAREAAGRFSGGTRIVFKKIDSLLRGNPGSEIRATAEAFGCDGAIVTPAFPVMKRVVTEGWLRVPGSDAFEPVDVCRRLREQGIGECVPASASETGRALAGGARFLSLDAACEEDLDRIAADALAAGRQLLWAGSGGLACALARALSGARRATPAARPHPGAVLFCLGSDHAVTLGQQRRLVESRGAALFDAETADSACVRATLAAGGHAVLRIPRGRVDPARLGALVANATALLVSGGDTAAAVCRAAGTGRTELCDEVLPGIPHGRFVGGRLDGIPVATKSGAFGGPEDLVEVADYFKCLK